MDVSIQSVFTLPSSSEYVRQSTMVFKQDDEEQLKSFKEKLIFPFVSEMQRKVVTNPVIDVLTFIILLFEIFSTFLFIFSNNNLNDKYDKGQIKSNYLAFFFFNSNPSVAGDSRISESPLIQILSCLVSFTLNNKEGVNLIVFIVIILYLVVIIFLVSFALIWYRMKRSFMKWQLVILSYLFFTLNLILFIPTCGFTGQAVLAVNHDNKSVWNVATLIFSLIFTVLLFFSIRIMFLFMGQSAFMSRTFFGAWDSNTLVNTLLLTGINAFFSILTNIFSNWFILVIEVFNIICVILEMRRCHYMPFIKRLTNAFFESVLVMILIQNIFLFVRFFYNEIDFLYAMAAPLAAFIIGLLVFYIVNENRVKKVFNILDDDSKIYGNPDTSSSLSSVNNTNTSTSNNNMMSSGPPNVVSFQCFGSPTITSYYESKINYFESLHLKSQKEAIFYLRYGIATCARLAFDFSFANYFFDQYRSQEAMFETLRISAFFPYQSIFLKKVISAMNSTSENPLTSYSIYQQCLLYQAKRINIIRQSSVSKEAKNDQQDLTNLAEETIALVRGFWNEILHSKSDISIASLYYIRNQTLKANSAFLDAQEKFPNSQQIMDLYCMFMVEAMGRYSDSITLTKKMRKIEAGKKAVVDHSFRCLVNCFPNYLVSSIVNTSGQLKVIEENGNAKKLDFFMSSQMSQSSKTTLNIQDILADDIYDNIVDNIFYRGKMRVALETAVMSANIATITFTQFLTIVQFISSVFIAILMIFTFPMSKKVPALIMKSAMLNSNIASAIQYASMITASKFLDVRNRVDLKESMKNQLSLNESDFPSFPSVFYKPGLAIHQLRRSIVRDLEEEMEMIIADPKKHQSEINTFGVIDRNNVTFLDFNDFISDNEDISPTTLSIRNGINMYTSNLRVAVELLNKTSLTSSKTLNYNNDEYNSNYKNNFNFNNNVNNIKSGNELDHDLMKLLNVPDFDVNQSINKLVNVIFNGMELSTKFVSLYERLYDEGIDATNYAEGLITKLVVTIIILVFIVFGTFFLLNFILLVRKIHQISIILRSVKEGDVDESSRRIYKKNDKKLNITNSHSANEVSFVFMFFGLICIISIVVITVIGLTTCFNYINSLDMIRKSFIWMRDGATRFNKIMYLLLNVVIEYDEIFTTSITTNSTTMGEIIRNITKLSQKLDLSLIGRNNNFFDDFYFKDKNSNIRKYNTSFQYYSGLNLMDNLKENQNNFNNLMLMMSDDSSVVNDAKLLKSKEFLHNFANFIDRISLSNKVNMGVNYYNMIQKEIQSINTNNGVKSSIFNTPEFCGCLFMIDKYLYKELREFQISLTTFVDRSFTSMNMNVIYAGIVGIFCFIVLFIIECYFITYLCNSINAFKQLLLFLPPESIVKNPLIMNFIIGNRDTSTNQLQMSSAEIVLNNSDMAVITVNSELIIQSVNGACQTMTGITPDGMLGRPLTWLLPVPTNNESKVDVNLSPFYQSIDEIKFGGLDMIKQVIATCRTEAQNENISVKISAIVHRSSDVITQNITNADKTTKLKNNNNNINSVSNNNNANGDLMFFRKFDGMTLLIRNLEEEEKLKNQMKMAKQRKTFLKEMIVPEGVLKKLRGKKKGCLFFSKCSVFIQMEIVGIDQMIATINSKQAMEYLSLFSKSISEVAQMYPVVRLIQNDMKIYAVCGLIDRANIQVQALSAVCFALDCIHSVDETNTHMGTNISLSVAIVLGKNVSGFIQNPTIPLFHFLMNQEMKVCEKLLTLNEINNVQITADILSHLDGGDFELKKAKSFVVGSEKHESYLVMSLTQQGKERMKDVTAAGDVTMLEDVSSKDQFEEEEEQEQKEETKKDEHKNKRKVKKRVKVTVRVKKHRVIKTDDEDDDDNDGSSDDDIEISKSSRNATDDESENENKKSSRSRKRKLAKNNISNSRLIENIVPKENDEDEDGDDDNDTDEDDDSNDGEEDEYEEEEEVIIIKRKVRKSKKAAKKGKKKTSNDDDDDDNNCTPSGKSATSRSSMLLKKKKKNMKKRIAKSANVSSDNDEDISDDDENDDDDGDGKKKGKRRTATKTKAAAKSSRTTAAGKAAKKEEAKKENIEPESRSNVKKSSRTATKKKQPQTKKSKK